MVYCPTLDPGIETWATYTERHTKKQNLFYKEIIKHRLKFIGKHKKKHHPNKQKTFILE